MIQNIQRTSGKWTLPADTKETDYCWFVVLWGDSKIAPYDLLSAFSPAGNTSALVRSLYKKLASELIDYSSSGGASGASWWTYLKQSKDVNHTPDGVIVKPYVNTNTGYSKR
ncbi:MAG: hypothetical protein ABS46_01390 [Cytophagaceae bacterium SCN 52-12]|nr:MAG: hypothetical protein ABS46_01390 [Cytophagaceae bacterium SCN 52-12]